MAGRPLPVAGIQFFRCDFVVPFLPIGIRNPMIYGNIYAMNTTIDSAGRLVIPKKVRNEAGLEPGMVLRISWRGGRIEIEPEPLPVQLVRRGRLLVAVPQGDAGVLSSSTVEQVRGMLREERPAEG